MMSAFVYSSPPHKSAFWALDEDETHTFLRTGDTLPLEKWIRRTKGLIRYNGHNIYVYILALLFFNGWWRIAKYAA